MRLSMTAYGSNTISYNNAQYLIEFYSVNRKGVDFTIHLPRPNLWLENELRKFLTTNVKRGQITLKISLMQSNYAKSFNSEHFKNVFSEFLNLERQLDSAKSFSLDFIFEQAQKQCNEGYAGHDCNFLKVLLEGVDKAFDEFMAMKKFEGQSLKKDFSKRISAVEKALEQINKLSAQTRVEMAEKIKAVAQKHKVLDTLEKDRFYAEVAFYCDKYDIHEECIRLSSHIKAIKEHLVQKTSVGARSTEFVLQEMMRETNTLCAKSPLSLVKSQGVLIKSEIEKFREQLQNVE